MRPQKVNDMDLMSGLMTAFRTKGYEGASLNDLAEATGLQKASLYHRFPGGKQAIAEAVLDFAGSWVTEHIRTPLEDKGQMPAVRLAKAVDSIRALYGNGKQDCILRALSQQKGLELFQDHITENMQGWIAGFYTLGVDLGYSEEEALERAEDTLILVQGGLIVGKGLAKGEVFDRIIRQLTRLYIG